MALNSSVSLSQHVDNYVISYNLPLVKCEDINRYRLHHYRYRFHHYHYCHPCHHHYHYCNLLITTRSLGISHSSSVRTDIGVRSPSARILSSVARIFISYLSIKLSTIVLFHFCPTLNVICTFRLLPWQCFMYFLIFLLSRSLVLFILYTLPSVLEKEPI